MSAVLLRAPLAPDTALRHATVEPRLMLPDVAGAPLVVAVTLDACPGGFDERIAATLIANRVRATIFLSGSWIRRNPRALDVLLGHRDLFAFGNHGERHLAPVLGPVGPYGVPAAGDLDTIRREIEEGAASIAAACGTAPIWYRGATARYSPEAIPFIESLGVRIAGYSLSVDAGASIPAGAVAARIAGARSGDVLIGHINQPMRPSGAGIAAGLLELQRRGANFAWLPGQLNTG